MNFKSVIIYLFVSFFSIGCSSNQFTLNLVTDVPSSFIIKNVNYIKQKPFYCGPASAEMVLKYHGINNLNQDDIASCDANNKTGTHWDKLIRYLNRQGNKNGYGAFKIEGDLNILKKYIASGYPVIVRQWLNSKKIIRHYKVVVGYDDNKQEIICNDPLTYPNMTIPYTIFMEYWNVQVPNLARSTKNLMIVIGNKELKK